MALRRELLEHLGVGHVGTGLALPAAREAHAVEEDLAELLGRAHVEALAGELVDLPFELDEAGREILREALELGAVDLDPLAFHGDDHGDERALDRLVDGDETLGEEL